MIPKGRLSRGTTLFTSYFNDKGITLITCFHIYNGTPWNMIPVHKLFKIFSETPSTIFITA